jgi:2,4-dienoyl-CoA reductase-like NADH-dependent reductase (Old Yellow Enzyme family)
MSIFDPIAINSMRLENRLVLTAMVTRLSGDDGYVNRDVEDRYIRYARGEVGLIVVEAMAVHHSKSGPLLRISEDRFVPGLRSLTSKIHDVSPSKVAAQIIHFLKISRSGWRQKITDLSLEDIRLIVDQYAAAASRAREAGFDAVELHMAHAYTLSSFLSRRNARKDEYGGRTLENRMRLMGEVIARCREAVGPDFPIGVRFDGEECIKKGYTVEDAKEIALRMAQLGVDYISVSAGGKFEDAVPKPGEPLYPYTGYSGERCMPGDQYPDAANLHLAEGIKRYINSKGYRVPVVASGKIGRKALAEEILASGRADLIGMARALLADPDLPKKWREGREDEVIRCIYCNVCKSLDENFQKVVCFLWPKGSLQAPYTPTDATAPRWIGSPSLQITLVGTQVQLSWTPAEDENLRGYHIYRSEDGAQPVRLTATVRTTHFDNEVVGGRSYAYYVRAYDSAGNLSDPTPTVTIQVPMAVPHRVVPRTSREIL